MTQEEALQKVSFDLNYPHGFAPAASEKAEPGGTLRYGVRNARSLQKIVEKVAQHGKIVVEFDVPAAVKAGLETGEYVRKGGVIVTSAGHKVVHWLREGRAIRHIGHAATLLFVVVDIWSEYVLNKKLKEIQQQLDRIEAHVRARHFALFRDAHEYLGEALRASKDQNRLQWLHKAGERFKTARNETTELLKDKTKEIHKELESYYTSRFHNTGELERIFSLLSEANSMGKRIAHCYQAESRILDALQEFACAEELRVEALNFQVCLDEYLSFFVDEGPAYQRLEFVQTLNLDCSNIPVSENQGRLVDRMRHIGRGFSMSGLRGEDVPRKVARTARENVPWIGNHLGWAVEKLSYVNLPGSAGDYVVSKATEKVNSEQQELRKELATLETCVPVTVFELPQPR